jgi:hypothetical protein
VFELAFEPIELMIKGAIAIAYLAFLVAVWMIKITVVVLAAVFALLLVGATLIQRYWNERQARAA